MPVKDRLMKALLVVGTLLFLFVAWQLVAIALLTPALPPPMEAFQSLRGDTLGHIIRHLTVSLYRVLLSMLLAVVLAVPLGLFLGKNQQADTLSAPLLYLTYPIPKVVFLPIFMVLLGIGNVSKVAMITLIVFFQLLIATRDAARNLQKEYVLSVRSLGASNWALYRQVYFPGCLPAILTALRLGLGTALAVLFLTETYATREGIGFYIMDSWSSLAYGKMFAGILAMGLLGFVLFLLLDVLEHRVCRWNRQS